MRQALLLASAILVYGILLASCGSPPATAAATETHTELEPSATPAAATPQEPTATGDPCTLPRLETEVQRVHSHMREFDDASALAGSIPREQLSGSIAELQRIRRAAEDEEIPPCLTGLQELQIQHMNSVIETLLAFMRGADQETLDQGITLARQQHDQYLLEFARLVGLTVVPATMPPPAVETPTP